MLGNCSSIESLSDDLLFLIFENLSPRNLAFSAARVCRRWRRLALHGHLWSTFRIESPTREFLQILPRINPRHNIHSLIIPRSACLSQDEDVLLLSRVCTNLRSLKIGPPIVSGGTMRRVLTAVALRCRHSLDDLELTLECSIDSRFVQLLRQLSLQRLVLHATVSQFNSRNRSSGFLTAAHFLALFAPYPFPCVPLYLRCLRKLKLSIALDQSTRSVISSLAESTPGLTDLGLELEPDGPTGSTRAPLTIDVTDVASLRSIRHLEVSAEHVALQHVALSLPSSAHQSLQSVVLIGCHVSEDLCFSSPSLLKTFRFGRGSLKSLNFIGCRSLSEVRLTESQATCVHVSNCPSLKILSVNLNDTLPGPGTEPGAGLQEVPPGPDADDDLDEAEETIPPGAALEAAPAPALEPSPEASSPACTVSITACPQLRHLEIHNAALELLREFPSLRHLNCCYIGLKKSWSFHTIPFLPNLQTLRVVGSRVEGHEKVQSQCLKSLHIRCGPSCSLSLVCPSLEKLAVEGGSVSSFEFDCPRLRSLHLSEGHVTPSGDFIGRLMVTCPLLTEIGLGHAVLQLPRIEHVSR